MVDGAPQRTIYRSYRKRPLWQRVLKWSALVVVCVVFLSAGAMFGWLTKTAAQVGKNDPAEVSSARRVLAPVLPSSPVNILVIGSDRRIGQPDLGARSDTLIVVRLDPRNRSISMLSVPRDLRVDIPGLGFTKINAAYSAGGARLAVQTVRQLLGIPINHFIDVNFVGFVKAVDTLGGAYLMVDRRYYNNTAVTGWSSINLQPGYQRLNGQQALSFVRFRHDQNGDFTRIVRQQLFLREMKRELAASATPTDFPRLLSVATDLSHYVVSDVSGLRAIYDLVSLALQLDTHHIYETHINGSTPTIGGISYVVATPQEVTSAVRQFLHPAVPHSPRATSASPTAGAAGRTPSASPAVPSPRPSVSGKPRLPYDLSQWKELARRTPLTLEAPTAWPAGLAYAEFRAYHVRTAGGSVPAMVAVGTAPQGGFWDVQAIQWADPPILAAPDATKTVNGQTYELFYTDASLSTVAWHSGQTTYWISNTLDGELTNQQMLALATSSVPVP